MMRLPTCRDVTPRVPAARGHRLRRTFAGACTLLVVAAPAGAQALKDPLVPAGRIRLDFSPSFTAWDSRFGIDPAGQDVVEMLSDDLTSDVGSDLLPGLEALQSSIRAMASGAGFSPRIGSTRSLLKKDVSRIDLSLELGLFDWLTVGATVPWVQRRTTVDLFFEAAAGADLGLSPTLTDGGEVNTVLNLLAGAAAGARARADAACQASAPDCQSAEVLAGQVEAFLGASQDAYSASPLFPTSGSAAAGELRRALSDLDMALMGAGLPSTGAVLPFATQMVDAATFDELASMEGAGIEGAPLADVESLWELGDVEVHATVRLLEGEKRDSGAARPGLRYVLAATGLVRFATGLVDQPDVFLDLPSGDGQLDVEGSVFGALRVGSRLGLMGRVRYGVQRHRALVRRVAPHEVVMPAWGSTRAVTWTPGAYLDLAVSPRVQITDELSLAGDYRFFSKAEDSYEIIGDATLGGVTADPADLIHESGITAHEVGVGFTFSTMEAWREGLAGSPLEFHGRVIHTVAGGGGRTPKSVRYELGFRIFRRIWGR